MECISHNDNEERKECSTVEREGKEQEEILQLRQQNLELKAALEASEAENRAKTSFLSSMSHDIRTPMNAIMGMTSIGLSHID